MTTDIFLNTQNIAGLCTQYDNQKFTPLQMQYCAVVSYSLIYYVHYEQTIARIRVFMPSQPVFQSSLLKTLLIRPWWRTMLAMTYYIRLSGFIKIKIEIGIKIDFVPASEYLTVSLSIRIDVFYVIFQEYRGSILSPLWSVIRYRFRWWR